MRFTGQPPPPATSTSFKLTDHEIQESIKYYVIHNPNGYILPNQNGLRGSWERHPCQLPQVIMKDSPTIQNYVKDLSEANVISTARNVQFAARLFSVPKKNSDKVRIILDLSPLNKFISCPTFRMTTTEDIMRLLPRDSYIASINIKDAYWQIPMSPAVQGLLGFRVENRFYCFRPLPFGLNIPPRIFTKVMSTVINQLRF